MDKLKYIVVIIIAITLVVGVTLVFRYRWFLKQLREEEAERRKSFRPMLSETVPYEKYKKICKKGSAKSSPIRKEGDFLDFILEHSDKNNPKSIESNLANLDVGETIL